MGSPTTFNPDFSVEFLLSEDMDRRRWFPFIKVELRGKPTS